VDAERRVLGGLEAGCAAPIGVASSIHDGQLELWASVYRPDGAQTITRSLRVSFDRDTSRAVALEMSDTLVAELLEAGAAELAPLGANR